MHDSDWVVMGYVMDAFGVAGWVKVRADTEHLGGLLDYPIWHLGTSDGAWQAYELVEGNQHANTLVAHLKGFSSRDQALGLKGLLIGVPRSQLPQIDEGEYYWVDLIGMRVRNDQGVDLGQVSDLLKTPAHDLLVVKDVKGEERLIPFVAAIIEDVNYTDRCIVAKWESDY